MAELARGSQPEPKIATPWREDVAPLGKTTRIESATALTDQRVATTTELPRHDFDQEVSLGPPFEFSRGKVTAVMKLDAKASSFGKVTTPVGGATLFDAKIAHAFLESSKERYRNKVSATLGKVETNSTSLDAILPVPGWHVKVEAAVAKVGNAKVEGPSVSIVAWCDVSADLPEKMRERCSLRLEIKIEMPVPAKDILKAIEEEEKLREEARLFEESAREEKAALELAKREVRTAEQALDRARLAKNSERIAEALERLRVAKLLKKAAVETVEVAVQGAKRLASRCIEIGLRIAERSAIYTAVERALIAASERALVRVVGHALGYLIPVVDVILIAYDLVQLGIMVNEVIQGRARFGLSDENAEFFANLQPGAAWAVGILEPGAKEIHPTRAQAEQLNAAVPNDLSPAEQAEIRARWKAMGKLDDFAAGIAALKKVVDEVRAKTRAPVTPEQLDATDTNPGAQRIAAVLGGSGILSGEEYRILCDTIPADLTLEELAKLKPYLQRKGQKADVRMIAEWIRELRAGEKIRMPLPGPGSDLTPGTESELADGETGGGDRTKKVEAATTTPGMGDGKKKSKKGGTADGTQLEKTGQGGTAGVLVPTTQTGTTKTEVHFKPMTSLANVKVGAIVRIAVSVPSRGISRTMSARVVARSGSRVTVELVLTQRVALQRSVRDHGPIFEAHQRITFGD
ncbi:MAG: hypothetical protein ABI678_13900 [Kofleriaceae bacterium]